MAGAPGDRFDLSVRYRHVALNPWRDDRTGSPSLTGLPIPYLMTLPTNSCSAPPDEDESVSASIEDFLGRFLTRARVKKFCKCLQQM